ncbi:transcriptional regulator [Rhizobium sp. Root73]|uniref:IclR family transcriptional regulator n=1 Tax=unclassified Rhizobium TaxID=2613769 RepID=UPI00072690D2|nr:MULTISPECIES: IclR family transcriptional regulator [unclassified Rhizobium]KQY15067.1 transcriptional regulator [Rhizobium sp. Root1334]KRC06499.1 transcriptional regulator [Rhizobium sp. Root73]
MDKDETAPTGTQLLDRAVAILRLLGEVGQAGATMAAIGEAMDLKQPTVHRIVSSLERHGFVDRERETKRYRLGLALFAMGAAAADGTGLRQISRPALLRLAAMTGDSVFLMARAGFNTVCVDRQQGTYIIDSLTGHIGGQIPMGVGPASQAILAFLPNSEVDVILATNAPLYKSFGGLSPNRIRDSLARIRTDGYALDEGDLVAGISAIAVPILPPARDAIAAIAINLTSARLSAERIPELFRLLKKEVGEIETQLNPLEEQRLGTAAAAMVPPRR